MIMDFLTHPIVGLTLLFLIGYMWRENRRIYELTLGIVRRACQAQGMQLLDGTIRLQSFRINFRNDFAVRRAYRFEYSSDGNQRQFGWVYLEGDRAQDLHLQDAEGQVTYQHLEDERE